jgi:DNA-binding transcriptional LysR family regulator
MQLVALGRVVAVLPETVRTHLRRDLVAVPVVDAAPSTLLLAWPARRRPRAVAAFARVASAVAAHRLAAAAGG